MEARAAYLRLLCAFGALAAGAGAVVVAALLVHGLPANASSAQSGSAAAATAPATQAPTSTRSAFPAPPPGAVVFATQAGHDVLALGVVPGKAKILLQASLVRTEAKKPVSVRFRVTGARGQHAVATATPCGQGCYRASAAVARPERVTVELSGYKPATFTMPAVWPPPSGAAIVARAALVWTRLNTLVFHDSYGDGRVTLQTLWKVVAPDRLSYRIATGEESIVIGDRRWIKPSGSKRWITTAQQPIVQPVPFWSSAVDARILGTVSVHGQPAWKISFFDPQAPGWFTILVDKKTTHTMDMRMLATAHFMHDSYGRFNGPLSIVPPRN
jgi:hypothetical protein